MRYEKDASYVPVRSDPKSWNAWQTLPVHFDYRDDSDIGKASGYRSRASRRNFKPKLRVLLLWAMKQSPYQRSGVQEANGADS